MNPTFVELILVALLNLSISVFGSNIGYLYPLEYVGVVPVGRSLYATIGEIGSSLIGDPGFSSRIIAFCSSLYTTLQTFIVVGLGGISSVTKRGHRLHRRDVVVIEDTGLEDTGL